MSAVESRQVSWWSVHIFADQLAAAHGVDIVADGLPHPGTPRWCGLPDGDARKLIALLLSASREALRHETEQQARAEASHDVSAAADWSRISQYIRDERDFYDARPFLRRVAS